VRIFVLGKVASVTNWLEDCVAALRADGHELRVAATRDPRISLAIERVALSSVIGSPKAQSIARAVRRFSPELILAFGGYHIPRAILEQVASIAGRAPLIGWVGDIFDEDAAGAAALFDTVAYTDTALVARHTSLGFSGPAIWLPHAVNPHVMLPGPRTRCPMMVLIANPTAHRRAVVDGLDAPMALYGPAWTRSAGVDHQIHARRVAPAELPALYAGHLAALNIRNELNVLDGLNQRNFAPCLFATAVVAEDQPDLAACFEPGREVFAWRDAEELNRIYARLQAVPAEATAVGERARRRVLADHTYAKRLEQILSLL